MKKSNNIVQKVIGWITINGLGGKFGATADRLYDEVVDEKTFNRLMKRKGFSVMVGLAKQKHLENLERELVTRLVHEALFDHSIEANIFLLNQIDPDKWKRVDQVQTCEINQSATDEALLQMFQKEN